jgi:hypothetical protein
MEYLAKAKPDSQSFAASLNTVTADNQAILTESTIP